MPGCSHFRFAADDPLANVLGLGMAALRYVQLGYAVIPLERGGKRPHRMLGDRGGIHNAEHDPRTAAQAVHYWWRQDPAANIGVATGSVNGLAVVDLDVKGGRDGPHELDDFLRLHARTLPYGTVARTPSGGWHVWLRTAGPVPERPGILPGVDVKGDGGLVVAPPSMQLVTPLRERGEVPVPYEWVSGCPHAVSAAPGWFMRWLSEYRNRTEPDGTGQNRPGGPPLDAVLETYMKDGIPEGQRNREIYRVACRLYRTLGTGASGAQETARMVRAIYDRTDRRGFTWNEVAVCLESARRFIEREERREAVPRKDIDGITRWLEENR